MSYELFLEPEVHSARHGLPGNVRQRLRRAMESLATNPRPANSNELAIGTLMAPAGYEIRRIRLDRWRVVYAVHDDQRWVWVLGIYRRPPYNYEDLADLAGRLG